MEKHVPSWPKRLRQERERHGWSQSQPAEKIGVDTKTIGRWENGKTLPRLDCRALLCELYGKTAEELGLTKEATATIFWRSLQNAPPFEHILQKYILFLSDNQQVDLSNDLEDQISLLVVYLRKRPCLLILDNIETILQSGDEAGHWREGYEGYGRLIKRIGETQHQSCLLLTSREKPKEVAHAQGKTSPVRSLPPAGRKSSSSHPYACDTTLVRYSEEGRH